MKNIEIVKKIGYLSILALRDIERNTDKRISNNDDLNKLLMNDRPSSTYEEGIKTLSEYIETYGSNEYIKNEIEYLKLEIMQNSIKNLRFGNPKHIVLTSEEIILNIELLLSQLEANQGMYGISEVSNMIGVSADTIKTACQRERLLNTKKIGKSWQVSLAECKHYWKK